MKLFKFLFFALFYSGSLYASCREEADCPKCCRDKYLVVKEAVKVFQNEKENLCGQSEQEFNSKILTSLKKRDFEYAYSASSQADVFRMFCNYNANTTPWDCIKIECREKNKKGAKK